MIVVDASVAVDVLLQVDGTDALMDRLFGGRDSLHAPHLLDVEVVHVIRRYTLAGDITPARGGEAIQDLADLPITRHDHVPLLNRMWQLRNNLTAYDAAYIALTEALDGVLLTRDRALARIPSVRVGIEVL